MTEINDRGQASVEGKHYKLKGRFHVAYPGTPVFDTEGILRGVTNPRDMTYIHSLGGEAQFFQALARGRLLATRCDNPSCEHTATVYLPFRICCPDCLERNTVLDVTQLANEEAKIHTFIVTARTGAFNPLATPIRFVDMEFPGIATLFKGYMSGEGEPQIGMRLIPIFRTQSPTYTILDISWVKVGTTESELPEGFTFSSPA